MWVTEVSKAAAGQRNSTRSGSCPNLLNDTDFDESINVVFSLNDLRVLSIASA